MSDDVKVANFASDVRSAVSAAQPLIESAATDASGLAEQLNRNGDDIATLQQHADRVRDSREVAPEAVLQSAMRDADGIQARLQRTGGQVDEIRRNLELAAGHLREGGKAHAKLEDELGGATPETDQLGKRLTDLAGAVQAAQGSLYAADERIGSARQSLRNLVTTDLRADRDGTETKIRSAHTAARDGSAALGTELKSATAKLKGKFPDLEAASTESTALAKAAHAALNPTPKSHQVRPGSASEQPSPARRSDGPTHEHDR
jgi:chromosome segregation ATPase